ncbi:mitochondrial thiamine pyrophosphate carrier-like [Ruditapes philippinarum]|uniref:mitochondrial thiamine pyrophosphate carrier-like n=1 Tax=Ruditapes philippinarum TaxID=129788 RepID=UPI00295AE022|nr:mitochondrial thiamine pyrophosphate carrier-like [Ruditapes philippinarum]XP_060559611.1 mitochondrial thiamine pyrophosphate carrier-like [Ruditapes philippinarum]XP_060559612.1 mitochondrial thiamine pyrophosphate carrier-like [Ruditapes philippinarum]XP_060559613.1 mitochondrial thiamine pyrophosphate carrier-like [Ruditapes philippinarum]XP_060559615.1 mitochondrial thiamine pyrophosphate carrier-like [Ruditapes philippinarum]XP_060559616.1 mitochondrial thiamine pyrophosphate carrier-
MVGYNPELKLTEQDYVIAAASSNAVARAVTQPFDVLKIRFQLQIEPISKSSSSSKYNGLYQAFRCIVKEESYRALWKGHIPAQVLSVGYGIVQFSVFEYTTKVAWEILPEKYGKEYRPLTHLICGGISACFSTMTVQPVDVLRTRFVAQGEPKTYTSLNHAARSIYRVEGVRGFYKGLTPAVIGIAPQMGLQFGFYALLQNVWNTVFNLPQGHHPDTIESFICGSGSGFFSKLLIYPLDLMKKRLQIQGFEEARHRFGKVSKYSGLVHCIKTLVKEEGILGLYKGLSPSLLKAMFVSGTIFCVYDQICLILNLRHG